MGYIDILGYVAIIITIISFVPDKEWMIRIVNSVACLLFVVYGAILHLTVIWVLNIVLLVLQCYKLYKLRLQAVKAQQPPYIVYNFNNNKIQK